MTDVPGMSYEECLFYEKNLRSVTANTRADGEGLLREAAEIPLRPKVTLFPLEEANRALQMLKDDRISGSGVLVVELSAPHHKYGEVPRKTARKAHATGGSGGVAAGGGRSEVKRSRAGSPHGEPRRSPRPRRRSRRVSPGGVAPSGIALWVRCRIYEMEPKF